MRQPNELIVLSGDPSFFATFDEFLGQETQKLDFSNKIASVYIRKRSVT